MVFFATISCVILIICCLILYARILPHGPTYMVTYLLQGFNFSQSRSTNDQSISAPKGGCTSYAPSTAPPIEGRHQPHRFFSYKKAHLLQYLVFY
uniref:Uncharacterized protein n=1 Tax=Aegilops tauschii subsp. strangulata TaxID=200361 RepID=A0A453JI76_AEGTS